VRAAASAALAVLVAAAACARGSPLFEPRPAELARAAPDSFDVYVETTRGPFVIRARRAWSPLGVDRFHYLVRHGFYDGARFFRVVRGFVAQFGLPGRPPLDSLWQARRLPDEPVRATNRRGTVAYARGGPNTRSIQLYVNLVDNTPRLDTLNTIGFPPIGEVLIGMAEVVDSLYAGYGGTREDRLPGPSQDSIRVGGNAYLDRHFPLLDRILQARIVREWHGPGGPSFRRP
jgi:cyclophilin family peptidyl-prolyl cis-trans isomerase